MEETAIGRGDLILVNARHPVENMDEKGMVAVDLRFPEIVLRRNAVNMLQLILKKIAAGSSIVPVSGYRSAKEQEDIYCQSLRDNGEEFTRKYVALKGHSEHQTGLAIDLGLNREPIDFIRPDFPYDGICEKFREAAPHYGFILRYEKEKESITGIAHEPWHFRYVGYPHSAIITENGFAMEEYIEFIKRYREENPLVWHQPHGADIEIYYVPFDGDGTGIALPENRVCRVSGNNADGFIVTLWRNVYV